MTQAEKSSVGKKIAAAIGLVAAVVGIVVGIYELTRKDPPPVTTNNTPVSYYDITMPDSNDPIYTTVAVPPEFATVYGWEYPTFGSSSIDELQAGETVELACTVKGDQVENADLGTASGPYRSSLWYLTDRGYVPDAYLDTRTPQPLAPACQ